MKPSRLHTIALAIACLLIPARAPAALVTYQNGFSNAFVTNYQGTDDTWIAPGGSADFNFGSLGPWVSPNLSGLVRFDLSSLAGEYSQINAITLRLNASVLVGNITSGSILSYAVLPANASWVEGTSFNAIQAGTATWNSRRHGLESWAGSPGLGTAGVDFASTPIGSFSYNSLGTFSMSFTGTPAELTALVDWRTGGATRRATAAFCSGKGTPRAMAISVSVAANRRACSRPTGRR